MTASDDITLQHDITPPVVQVEDSPEDADDRILEGDESASDLDKVHELAFGDENNDTLTEEINRDEIARVKDLLPEQQQKHQKSS